MLQSQESTVTCQQSEKSFDANRKHAGIHLLAEFWDPTFIDDAQEIETLLGKAAKAANSTLLKAGSYQFDPHGVTAFVILAESHISIHSWPEVGYIAIDIFTCGDHTMPHKAIEFLQEVFRPEKVELKEVTRGIIS